MRRGLVSVFAVLIIITLIPLSISPGKGEINSDNEFTKSNPSDRKRPENINKINADLDWGKMPVYFIENRGQMDASVLYYVQGSDKTIYFTRTGVTFALTSVLMDAERKSEDLQPGVSNRLGLTKPDPHLSTLQDAQPGERWAVKLDFVNANSSVQLLPEEKQETIVSYFKGKPEDWHAGLATYTRLVYRNLWPGIDLVYQGTTDALKFKFVVQPGADPRQIQLAYRGASSVKINDLGQLEVNTPLGDLRDATPIAYQEVEGKRVEVAMAYALAPALTSTEARFGFALGDYDPALTLVLDPVVLVYCGYIGGSEFDKGFGIAVDESGAAYVTGYTESSETTFPGVGGPDLVYNGNGDAFIAKVGSDGSGLIYASYIGGSEYDIGYGISVDDSGAAYVTGYTLSSEATFPVIGGPDLIYNGFIDAFIAKVQPDGSGLVYAGYIGGADSDYGFDIAVDSDGAAYVTGGTYSTEATFPMIGGPDLTWNDSMDAFVVKVGSDGKGLVYAGYIGGENYEYGTGIAVDSKGSAYVTGITNSNETTFPLVNGPDLTYNGGVYDAFVTKVQSDGSALVYSGYIGGDDGDLSWDIAVDSDGAAYVTGSTGSSEDTFPVSGGPDLTFNGAFDAFIAKVHQDGSGLVYAGYIGGSQGEIGSGIAVDSRGCAYVIGKTSSSESTFPVVGGPDLTYNGGDSDAFIASVESDGSGLIYAGYIGGSGQDIGWSIAVDSRMSVFITGVTNSSEASFPVVGGPDLTYNGLPDAFVAKIRIIEVSIYLPILVR